MIDKVQEIIEEVEKISKSINPFFPDEYGKNSEYEAGRLAMATQILQYIDSMQEEPKFNIGDRIRLKGTTAKGDVITNIYQAEDSNTYFEFENSDDALADKDWELVKEPKKCMYAQPDYTNGDRLVLCEDCNELCKYNQKTAAESLGISQEVYDKIVDECIYGKEPEMVDVDDSPKGEPVSDDLEVAADNCYFRNHACARESFIEGANWQKEHLWKSADGDDLPEIDREVIALLDNGKVVYSHRPPEYWDGKDIVTGKVTRNYPKTYDKGGWNIPNVKWWLDCSLPNMEED